MWWVWYFAISYLCALGILVIVRHLTYLACCSHLPRSTLLTRLSLRLVHSLSLLPLPVVHTTPLNPPPSKARPRALHSPVQTSIHLVNMHHFTTVISLLSLFSSAVFAAGTGTISGTGTASGSTIAPYPTASAPYPFSNSTTSVGPTGTGSIIVPPPITTTSTSTCPPPVTVTVTDSITVTATITTASIAPFPTSGTGTGGTGFPTGTAVPSAYYRRGLEIRGLSYQYREERERAKKAKRGSWWNWW